MRKGELLGFRIPGRFIDVEDPEPDEPDQIANFRVDTIPEGRFFIGKANLKQIETEEKLRDPWHLAVRFEGVLLVTNPDLLRTAIKQGIGSAKGYGFGLCRWHPHNLKLFFDNLLSIILSPPSWGGWPTRNCLVGL